MFPFRRYQVSPVWRADKPAPGRFREFVQFDLDSVGDRIGSCRYRDHRRACAIPWTHSRRVLTAVRFSSRKILNLLLRFASIPETTGAEVFRVLDKLEKIGAAKVRLELTGRLRRRVRVTRLPGVGLTNEQVDKIEQFLAIRASDRDEVARQPARPFLRR